MTQETALRRAERHVDQLRQLAPRAGAADAIQRCRRVVQQYFKERTLLSTVNVREVAPVDRPSDQAIQYAWRAALGASKRGDGEAKAKWIDAAKRMLSTRGVTV